MCDNGLFGILMYFGVFGRCYCVGQGSVSGSMARVGQAERGTPGTEGATKTPRRQHQESCQEFQPQISAQIKALLV